MRITIGNWLYNAGIVGFLRILREAGIDISDSVKQGYVELTSEMLANFEKAYLKYVIKFGISPFSLTYKKSNKKGKKEQFKELPAFFDSNNDFKGLIQEYNNNLLEVILSSDDSDNIISKIEISLGSYLDDISEQLQSRKEELLKLQETTNDKGELKKIKSIIKKVGNLEMDQLKHVTKEAIQDLYFLFVYLQPFYKNREIVGQAKYKNAKNRLDAFRLVYVDLARQSLNNNIEDGVICRFCNQNKVSKEIKKDDKSNVIFNETYFSVTGVSVNDFSNFFYKGLPDLFMCNVCKLILLCSFAGLNKKPYQLANSEGTDYIFVNMPSLEFLISENDEVKRFFETFSMVVKDSIYEHILQNLLLKKKIKESKWVLQNVFFVELRPSAQKNVGKPVFKYFHIGKDIAELFSNEKVVDSLRNVKGILILQKKVKGPLNFQKDIWVDIKSNAIKRLLENNSLYPLVYKNLIGILDNGKGNSYNSFVLAFIQAAKKQINIHYSKGGELMDSRQVYDILKGQFFEKGKLDFADLPIDKKERLSYRLLSFIRTGKYAEFYEAIMKLYINAGKPIPETLLGLLNTKDTIDFEAKAYAFMSGFLQDVKKPEDVTNLTAKEGAKDE